MKAIYKILFFVLAGIGCAACEKPELSESHGTQINGLLNVTMQIPDNPAEYYATKKGPYAEGEEIIVKLPTTDENPLDVSRIICTVSLEHNCYINPPMTGEMDFTEPLQVTVTDALGNQHHHSIRVEPTPPKTTYELLWEKNATSLGLTDRNTTGIAINGQYLVLQHYNGSIYYYDRSTGEQVKTIPAASTFMMKARFDDAGHLITSRENVYGAGFMVYYYSEEDMQHHLLLDYTAAAGCPTDLGYNMNVIGNVLEGKSYIYGLTQNDMNIYYWELQDGELVTPADQPNMLRYGPAGGNWPSVPAVQRASLDDASDHYIAYNKWTNAYAIDDEHKAHFNIFTSAMEVTELNIANHEHRILGFNVFDCDADKYLALYDMTADAYAGGAASLKVFDITDPAKMELAPTDAGYNDFRLFAGTGTGYIQNYFNWGDVSVYKEETVTGYDVYIATTAVGFDPNQSIVQVYKMTYFRQ